MSADPKYFHTADGVQLAYEDAGSGPAVILVPGFSCIAAHWKFQQEALVSAGYRAIAVNLRFHGPSDFPATGQRISRLGADLAELIEHLGLNDVALVGHSMGVSVCLSYIDLFGTEKVRSFAAIDQSPKLINDETWDWGVRLVDWSNVWDSVNGRFAWGDPSREPEAPAHVVNLFEEVGGFWNFPESVVPLLADHFAADWRDVLPRVDVPTWVSTGRFSPSFPIEGMEWMTNALPNASLSVFEESGHCPHWNEP